MAGERTAPQGKTRAMDASEREREGAEGKASRAKEAGERERQAAGAARVDDPSRSGGEPVIRPAEPSRRRADPARQPAR